MFKTRLRQGRTNMALVFYATNHRKILRIEHFKGEGRVHCVGGARRLKKIEAEVLCYPAAAQETLKKKKDKHRHDCKSSKISALDSPTLGKWMRPTHRIATQGMGLLKNHRKYR